MAARVQCHGQGEERTGANKQDIAQRLRHHSKHNRDYESLSLKAGPSLPR